MEKGNFAKISRPRRYQLRFKERAAKQEPGAATDVGDQLAAANSAWSAELITEVEDSLFRLLAHGSLSAKQVAKELEVSTCQAKRWLVQLEKVGKVVRTARPPGYQWNVLELLGGEAHVTRSTWAQAEHD